MSEYNSPTYLGPSLVGLANIGAYAELESTRILARLIEERIWVNIMARWHAPTQQLAGPHSRAYADSTLGCGGIIRYLAHAVLDEPIFWDYELAKTYNHHQDAEWACKIAATTFNFPDYLRNLGEKKEFPFSIHSTTDGEDYTVDGQEVYRGGTGRLTTYLNQDFCLGSAERPYIDGGQTESCIAYWRRRKSTAGFDDIRSLYFRYVANERLPGQENTYYNWYGKREMVYSANLLHQDGRLHVLQFEGKAIVVAQPLRRENGYISSLKFDALLPLYTDLDEIWCGDRKIESLPFAARWERPITIRDQDIYLSLRALQPTDLGGASPELAITCANHHLIISSYNLRKANPAFFPAYTLDQAHNGFVVEIGTAAEFDDFTSFRRHIAKTELSEILRSGEIRQIRYRSGQDQMSLHYNPHTQETIFSEVNGSQLPDTEFDCPYIVQDESGRIQIGETLLTSAAGIQTCLIHLPVSDQTAAFILSPQAIPVHLETSWGTIHCDSVFVGRILVQQKSGVEIHIDAMNLDGSIRFTGFEKVDRVFINDMAASFQKDTTSESWVVR